MLNTTKYFYIFSFLFLLCSSCKQAEKENAETKKPSVEEIKKLEVKLYTFSGGIVMVNNLELFSQDTTYHGQSKEFVDPFYVITHPKGTIMWDAGLPEGLVGMEAPFTSPDGNFTVSRNDSLISQLESIGMKISDFKYIALSHTHFDHSGHANKFKDATWLVQESEYDFVTSEESQKTNTDNYNAIKELTNVKKLNGDFDVFEDGSIIIKSLPGHTPGHQALFIDLPEHGPLLLTGDLYHLYENREHKRMPVFNSDVEQTLASMEAFEAFAKEKKAKVYIQHQKEDFNKLPKVPEYLK